jgi:NitT/TauT family transport system substrate-binding protein
MMNCLKPHLVATLRGNSNAYNEVVSNFKEMALRYANKKLQNHFLAEEAVQEAFLTAFLNLPSLRNLNCFPQWFRSIIVTSIGRSIKQNDLNIPFTDLSEISNIPDTVQSEIDSLDHFKTLHRIQKTMLKLGPENRKVCNYYYLQGFSNKEIAHILDLPIGTVKRRLHDARKQICKLLKLEDTSRHVRVGYMPISDHLLAMVSHYIGDDGSIRIELQKFLSWSSLLNAVCVGSLDVAFIMATLAFKLKNRGVPISYILDAGYGGSALTVRESIQSAKALNGIRIGLPSVNSIQFALLKLFLSNENISIENEIQPTYFSPSYSIGAFRNHLIDGFFCAEPWNTKAVQEGIGRTLVRSEQIAPGHVCCIVVANNNFAKSQGEDLHQYVLKLLSASDYIRSNPKNCSMIQAYYTGIDRSIAEHVIESGFISYSDLIPDKGRTEKAMDLAVSSGILDRSCNLDEFISRAFL